MLTTGAVLYGDRERLLGFDPAEHPVALLLGGSEPRGLAQSARIGEDFGYDEINLNVGCPSDRVQEGRFGACLMAEAQRAGSISRVVGSRGTEHAFNRRVWELQRFVACQALQMITKVSLTSVRIAHETLSGLCPRPAGLEEKAEFQARSMALLASLVSEPHPRSVY